jgi:hypothetical protein|tara:strand:+ start:64 stop:363 length:300 start_codon:yes stop_codon:yes gene_type:complete
MRKVKELDPYIKSRVGEALLKLRELSKLSNIPGTSTVYYEGNWVIDIHNNYTDKQAEKIFATAKSYTDKLDFFQKKTNYTYENVDDSPIPSYEYIARVQ